MGPTSGLFDHGTFAAFATAFAGGLATALTPCVYPMISITLSIFGAREEKVSRAGAMWLASLYVFGICVMYATLGVAFALVGKAADFGSWLGKPTLVIPLALLFLAMAASMFGAFEIDLPQGLKQRLSGVGGKGPAGAFLMGLVGGIIAAPCTGPALLSILAWVSTSRSAGLGGSLLFTYGLGMGVLFFVAAAFASGLPRAGAWMESVKSVFGIMMVIAAIYYLRPIAKPLQHYGSLRMGFLLLQIGLIVAGLVLGAIHLTFHGTGAERVRKALGVAAVVAGGFGLIAYALTPTPLKWVYGEQAGLEAARAAHTPAMLDFFADWCLPCKEMEVQTFSNANVARELERFTLVKIDTTNDDDPSIAELKTRYQAGTLPTVVLLDAAGKIVRTFNKQVAPDELLPALQAIAKR